MHHYEITFMIHPDQSQNATNIVKQYTDKIISKNGKVHRIEDWGRRQLAYPIKKLQKAHYILINIEISKKILENLQNNFRINDNIIRSLIIKVKKAITESSIMLKPKEENFHENTDHTHHKNQK